MQTTLEIYTDGACSGNPGPGGYAALLCHSADFIQELTGYEAATTNNRMELMGAITALEHAPPERPLRIYTDSTYVKDGITLWIHKWRLNQWRNAQKEPVKNQDLWKRLDALTHQRSIEWCWVRGHQGHPLNERADALARQAVLSCMMGSASP